MQSTSDYTNEVISGLASERQNDQANPIARALRSLGAKCCSQTAVRLAWILFGGGTQLLFLWTVVKLFQFLRFGSTNIDHGSLFGNVLLAVGFAFPHSILLVPAIQSRMKKHIPAGLLGCVHCFTTCLCLLVLIHSWRHSPYVLWHATGWAETLVLIGFYGSWGTLFYSLYLTGLGYQTGLLPWWCWIKNSKPPKREFIVSGSYRWMRHPVYMSFLGLIWFTPIMTADHAVLTFVWTVYIYVGSYLKDQRLIRFIGKDYLEYAARVPGLPVIGFGSLRYIRPDP